MWSGFQADRPWVSRVVRHEVVGYQYSIVYIGWHRSLSLPDASLSSSLVRRVMRLVACLLPCGHSVMLATILVTSATC